MTNNSYAAEAAKPAYTEADRLALAATIYAEARGEGLNGMRAVAHVIVNRANAAIPQFGIGIKGVVLKPKQFSCWNGVNPDFLHLEDRLEALTPGTPDAIAWKVAKLVAQNVLSKQDHDLTGGAVYYHAKTVNPTWASSFKRLARVGSHIFYA